MSSWWIFHWQRLQREGLRGTGAEEWWPVIWHGRLGPVRNLAMGETYIGLVRNIPTRVPSALVVRTHLADLVYTLLCSHLRSSLAQCVKGGGAKKMLQTAKTFVTKLVRYIEWIVDPLRGHQFYLIWYCYGQKRPFFWPKSPFLAIRGSRRLRWLAKVDQMVDHSWTHVGGLT